MFNKRFRFLLCVTDTFRKFAWAFPLKDKKGVSMMLMHFKKFSNNLTENQARYG